MILSLFRSVNKIDVPQQLYEQISNQSRNPEFFTRYGFPDSVTGRFDCLAFHLFIFSRRLVRESSSLTNSLNQEVFDRFVDETDRALRELGVGDTSVPKRKKKLVRGFYALVEALSKPLDEDDGVELEAKIAQRFQSAHSQSQNVDTALISRYVTSAANHLDQLPVSSILKGSINWPDPASFN